MFQSSMQQADDDFDQEPGEDEIHEYAVLIGIDPDKEPELMWIARAGITAPLPPEWKPIQTNDNDLYFYNNKTGESSWEHPSDDKYRQMVLEERKNVKLKNQIGTNKNANKNVVGSSSATVHQPFTPPTSVLPPSLQSNSLQPVRPPLAKLAPVSSLTPSTLPNSAPPRLGGKLTPLNSTSTTKEPQPPPPSTKVTQSPKPAAAAAPPKQQQSTVADRPKSSRGPSDRSHLSPSETTTTSAPKRDATPSPQPQVVGGGSRFLKKNEPAPSSVVPPSSSTKADVLKVESPPKKSKVLGRMDYVESASEDDDDDDDDDDDTPSSVLSGPLDGELAADSHLFLDVDHLTPAKVEPKPSKQSQNTPSKPAASVAAAKPAPIVKQQSEPTAPSPKTTSPSQQKLTNNTSSTVVVQASLATKKPETTTTPQQSTPAKTVVVSKPTPVVDETKLKTEMETRLNEAKQKLLVEEETQKGKLKSEMNARIKKFQTELEQSENKQNEELRTQHEKNLKEMKEKLTKENERLRNELSNEEKTKLSSTEISFDNELRLLKEKFEKTKKELEDDFARDFKQLKVEFETKLRRETDVLEREKIEKIKTLKSKIDKEIEDERTKLEREKTDRSLILKQELDEIEKDIESEKNRLTNEKSTVRANEKKLLDEKMKEMQESVEREVSKRKTDLKQMHDREIADLQSEFEIHLTKLRRENKEKLADEEQKIKSVVVAEKEKRDDKEKIFADTEIHMKNLRQELNALSELAKNLKASIGGEVQRQNNNVDAKSVNGRGPMIKSHQNDKKRRDFVKSLDGFLSPEEEAASSSSTPLGQKLEMLESEDIVAKVQRFLVNQQHNSSHQRLRTGSEDFLPLHQQRASTSFDVSNPPVASIPGVSYNNVNGNRQSFSVKDALETLQKDLQSLNMRVSSASGLNGGITTETNRNIFRLHPRDSVDEFVESRYRHYFADAQSRYDDRRCLPNDAFENRRVNVESELNSLKKWLEQFENDVAKRKISIDFDNNMDDYEPADVY